MIKKSFLRRSLFALSVVVSPAFAGPAYFGGNFAVLDYSEEGVSGDASLQALNLRLGTFFNENISGELRVGMGIGDDSVSFDGVDVDVELKHVYGIYLKGGIPVGEAFYPYAVIGYTKGKLEASAYGASASASESDMSFGIGADVSLSETVKLNGEYTSYLDKDGGELTGFSLGISKSF